MMDDETRIESILKRIKNVEIYFKECMKVDLQKFSAVKYHRNNTISLDSSDEDQESPLDDSICEHPECHRIRCKLE